MNPNMTESDWLSGLKNRCNGYELPTTVVAIENNILLGSAALITYDMDTKMKYSPWLAGVYVKEEVRNQGIGKKLIEEIEKIAEELNIKTIYLFTSETEQYYQSLGWTTIEKVPYRSINAIIMKKCFK